MKPELNSRIMLFLGGSLAVAAAYHVLAGLFTLVLPDLSLHALVASPDPLRAWWRLTGFTSIALGVGFGVCVPDPVRHWPVVLVAGVLKALCLLAFPILALAGQVQWSGWWVPVVHDLIWLPPFVMILQRAYRMAERPVPSIQPAPVNPGPDVLDAALTQDRQSLCALSKESPLLVVFLRHFGCTFCRETLSHLQDRREAIEAKGAKLVLVHMGDEDEAVGLLGKYGLEAVPRISDPEAALYRAFDLQRGTFVQLFGFRVLWRGMNAALLAGHGVGRTTGDGFQMPGVFLLYRGKVLAGFRHRTVADRPDYEALASFAQLAHEVGISG